MGVLTEDLVIQNLSNDIKKYEKMFGNYVNVFENVYYDYHGKKPSVNLKASYLKNLYGFYDEYRSLGYDVGKYIKEDVTTPDSIGAFIHYGFDIITAIYATMIVDEFVSVQGMDRRIGEIFYADFKIGDNKGTFQKGDDYLGAKVGPRAGRRGAYSSELVDREILGQANGGNIAFSKKLDWLPIKLSVGNPIEIEFVIGNDLYSAIWDGVNISGSGSSYIDSINFNNNTGTLNVTFGTAPTSGNVYVSYVYNSTAVESADFSGLPSITMSVVSKLIEAKRRTLKTEYLLDSVGMLSKEHGLNLENELLKAVVAGVSNEIQVQIAYDLWKGATAGSVEFDMTQMPANGYPILYRPELVTAVTAASTLIEKAVRRVRANFVIGGADFCNVVRVLPKDIFEPVVYKDAQPVGMHVIGLLRGEWKVIQNYDYDEDKFLVGAKGNGFLYTGYVYAPFIPIMTSKPYTDENLVTKRVLLTYYGSDFVNTNFYAKGRVKKA